MTKAVDFDWKVDVPAELQAGILFDRWSEEKDSVELETQLLFRVDEFGFFLHWQGEGEEGEVLEISQINDIRVGEDAPRDARLQAALLKAHGENFKDKSLTICSGLDMVNINSFTLICPTSDIAKTWMAGLRLLANNIKMNNICPTMSLKKHWLRLRFLVSPEGKVQIRHLTKTFASGKTEKLVYHKLTELGLPSGKADTIELEDFTFQTFYKIYQSICPRNDIDDLFRMIKGDKAEDFIECDKLIEFLNEKQRDPRLNEILYPHYNKARVMEMIYKHETDPAIIAKNGIGKEGFTRYLMSDENSPVFLDRLDIYQDMDQPLSHYYINSSHNTYLTGRQIGGKSAVEMYRQVLLAGCRCVELDCWDGKGEDQEPIITHGRAMCSEIFFKDVIYAIRDCAFVTSEYPIILSFENHCSRPQQLKMAKYCVEIFGDMLLKETLPDVQLAQGVDLPPPSKLKGKILIKNKRLRPEVEKYELELYWKGEFSIDENEEPKEDASAAPTDLEKKEDSSGAGPDAVPLPLATQYQGSTTNIHPYLSSLVNYTCPMKFQGFEYAEQQNLAFKMSSFPETNALGYLKTQAVEFVKYNKRQLSRIYPKGTRADSSNFMPQVFWNSGCQLVSLNFQTSDLPMQLNQGKFEYNGKCGYLLKPDFMRREDKQFDPFAETPVDGVIAAHCSVEVISGQFLSDKKIGTYVEVDMYGLPTDTIRKEFRTKVVPQNGLNPVYNEEPFVFRKVVLPELAVLRFGVYDDNGKLLGQRILPFNDLQAGYRHIALRTEGNFPMSLPMLFCNIELKIYIPDGLGEFMDALSDPRAFLSAQEKRAEQLKAMGIQESDIGKDIIEGVPKKLPTLQRTNVPKREDDIVEFPAITSDVLMQEKAYAKAVKKHQKELETIRKRHAKEKSMIQKTQCLAIDKLCKTRGSSKNAEPPECKVDSTVRDVVLDQMDQWTEMLDRHRKEDMDLQRTQMSAQHDILRKIMETLQAQQMKDLEAKLEQDKKDMKAAQARASVEALKDVQNDKSLKTKAEKERRIREKNDYNTKKFIDERKSQAIKHAKEQEKLRKVHEKQVEELNKYLHNIQELNNSEEIEKNLAASQECFV